MIAVAVASILFVQQRPPQEQIDAVNVSAKLLSEGKYYAALTALEKAAKNDKPGEPSFVSQAMAWLDSYVGEYDAAIQAFDGQPDSSESSDNPSSLEEIDKAKPESAIEAIVKESKDRQIVILNEAHHVPRCRAFGLQLAKRLRREGFDYFAAETFTPALDAAYSKGIVTLNMGSYTLEPMFGDFVRQVEKLGYKAVRYEAETFANKGDQADQINDRETQQANKLFELTLKLNPKARVFVYCGYEHAEKTWRKLKDGREFAWMAGRLAKLTGLDPLTIDQTTELPHSRPGAETAEFRYAAAKRLLRGDTVFRKPDGKFAVFGASYKDRVDLQVFHPITPQVGGRPQWTSIDGYRHPFVLPAADMPLDGRVLIQAFVSKPGDEVPIDQILVEAGKPAASLMLPKGQYRLVAQNSDGTSKSLGNIRQG